jgi:hypothetical protein
MPSEDSPIESGYSAAWIEEGVITKVDSKNRVVDWEATFSGRRLYDLSIYTSYAHNKYGEGQKVLPDQGAKCVVCQPSDDSAPFVFAFATDTSNKLNDKGEVEISAKADEAKYGPGDYIINGRDGNFFYLQRGGVLKFGSGPANCSTYIPVSNLLWHSCKRYKLDSFGGDIEWSIDKATTQDSLYKFTAKEMATDTEASVMLSFGKVKDATPPPSATGAQQVLAQFSISPQSIPKEGIPSAQVISYVADKVGNEYRYAKGTITTLVGQDLNITINQNKTENISGNLTEIIAGNVSETITGTRSTTAMSQMIKALTEVTITAPICKFGGDAAANPGLNGPATIAWLASHVHPGPGMPAVSVPALPSLLAGRYLYL